MQKVTKEVVTQENCKFISFPDLQNVCLFIKSDEREIDDGPTVEVRSEMMKTYDQAPRGKKLRSLEVQI